MASNLSNSSSNDKIIVGHHYPAIDGLRGFACLMVLWFHSSYFAKAINPDVPSIYYNMSVFGQTGVDLFFVLSGFLITGILMDTAYDKHVFRKFYIRRSLRIFPLYYGFLLAFALCVFFSIGAHELKDIFAYLFYVQNFSELHRLDTYQYLNHTWSLAVEEQFYLIWPLVFLSIYKRSVKWALILCVGLFAFSLLSRILLVNAGYPKFAYTFLLSHLDGLVVGAFLSILYREYKDKCHEYRGIVKLLSAFLCFVVLINFMIITDEAMLVSGVQLTIISMIFTGVLMLMVTGGEDDIFNKFFSAKFLQHIGKISYGLYIFHVPVMNYMGYELYEYQYAYWINHSALLVIGGIVAYIISFLSFNFYEKRFLKLKYKYAP